MPLSAKQNIQIPTQIDTFSSPGDAFLNGKAPDPNEATLTKQNEPEKVVPIQTAGQSHQSKTPHSEHTTPEMDNDEQDPIQNQLDNQNEVESPKSAQIIHNNPQNEQEIVVLKSQNKAFYETNKENKQKHQQMLKEIIQSNCSSFQESSMTKIQEELTIQPKNIKEDSIDKQENQFNENDSLIAKDNQKSVNPDRTHSSSQSNKQPLVADPAAESIQNNDQAPHFSENSLIQLGIMEQLTKNNELTNQVQSQKIDKQLAQP